MPELEEEKDLSELVSRFLGIAVRRRWWILGTASAVLLATITVLLQLPDRYTSSAMLLVVQQQVPERYVVPNSATDLASALQAVKQDVLSRTRLLKMIDDLGLYPKQRQRLAPEDLITLMLKDIDIVPLASNVSQKDFDAFKIFFTTENAVLAQQVTGTLTSLFINENLRTREEQASNTTKFLHEQLEVKKRKLDEQEQRLRDFKMQHVGELPEQQQGNLGILTAYQSQLQSTLTSLSRAEQQKVYLQSLLDAYRRQRSGTTAPGHPNATRLLTPIEAVQNELVRLESQRSALQAKAYTSQHPDMVRTQREIASAEETLRRLKAAAPADKEEIPAPAGQRPPATVVYDSDEQVTAAQISSQLEANRVEIENLSKDERKLKGLIAQYENRLNRTPYAEQQQASIIRETEALRQEYAELQKKEQESQLATNLEKQQGGQQFRIVDSASLPTVPSSPKRLKISSIAALLGILLGVGLAFLMEMRDTSFHTEKELTQRFTAPLVIGLPVLPTPDEARRRKRTAGLEWAAGILLILAVSVAQFYIYRRG